MLYVDVALCRSGSVRNSDRQGGGQSVPPLHSEPQTACGVHRPAPLLSARERVQHHALRPGGEPLGLQWDQRPDPVRTNPLTHSHIHITTCKRLNLFEWCWTAPCLFYPDCFLRMKGKRVYILFNNQSAAWKLMTSPNVVSCNSATDVHKLDFLKVSCSLLSGLWWEIMHHSDWLMENPTTASETCAVMLLKHHILRIVPNFLMNLSPLWQVLCKPQDICCGFWTVRVYTRTHRLPGQHTGNRVLSIFYSFNSENVPWWICNDLFGFVSNWLCFVDLVVRSFTQTVTQSLVRMTRVSVVTALPALSGSCLKNRWRFCPM